MIGTKIRDVVEVILFYLSNYIENIREVFPIYLPLIFNSRTIKYQPTSGRQNYVSGFGLSKNMSSIQKVSGVYCE